MPLSVKDQQQLIEAQVIISKSLQGINETLVKINDQNILHHAKSTEERKSILEKIQIMTAKYWWLILLLVMTLIVIAGAEKVFKFLP